MKPDYIQKVGEPWFTLIKLGLKTVEGRLNKKDFKEMKVGDIVKWTNNDFYEREVLTKIVSKTEYDNFHNYLKKEGLSNCLPGVTTIDDGKSVYYKYYTKEAENEYGVVAIKVKVISGKSRSRSRSRSRK